MADLEKISKVKLGDYSKKYTNSILLDLSYDDSFEELKNKLFLETNDCDEETFNSAPLEFINVESIPVEICLYNDVDIIKNPFVITSGAHEAGVAENADQATSEHMVNVLNIYKNIKNVLDKCPLHSRNSDSSSKISKILIGSNNFDNAVNLSSISSTNMFNAVNCGMKFDYNKLNQLVTEVTQKVFKDGMENNQKYNGSYASEFIDLILNELEYLDDLASIKNAENTMLKLNLLTILDERKSKSFNLTPRIINATNLMYFIADQSQNRILVQEFGLAKPDEETYFPSLRGANISPTLETLTNTDKDLVLMVDDYQNAMKNMQFKAILNINQEDFANYKKDDNLTFFKYINKPYDETSREIVKERFFKSNIALFALTSNAVDLTQDYEDLNESIIEDSYIPSEHSNNSRCMYG